MTRRQNSFNRDQSSMRDRNNQNGQQGLGERRGHGAQWQQGQLGQQWQGQHGRQGQSSQHNQQNQRGIYGRSGQYEQGSQWQAGPRGDLRGQAHGDWGGAAQYDYQKPHFDSGTQSFDSRTPSRDTSWHTSDSYYPSKADYTDFNANPYEREGRQWLGGEESYRSDDNRSSQSFIGKGPKGYRRSDERIKEDVCDCLARDPRIDASEIEVEVKDCCVTLSGTVDRKQTKRSAEMLVENLNGVDDVINEIRVRKETDSGKETLWAGSEQGKKDNKNEKSLSFN